MHGRALKPGHYVVDVDRMAQPVPRTADMKEATSAYGAKEL
jgi:hypothetical protein